MTIHEREILIKFFKKIKRCPPINKGKEKSRVVTVLDSELNYLIDMVEDK